MYFWWLLRTLHVYHEYVWKRGDCQDHFCQSDIVCHYFEALTWPFITNLGVLWDIPSSLTTRRSTPWLCGDTQNDHQSVGKPSNKAARKAVKHTKTCCAGNLLQVHISKLDEVKVVHNARTANWYGSILTLPYLISQCPSKAQYILRLVYCRRKNRSPWDDSRCAKTKHFQRAQQKFQNVSNTPDRILQITMSKIKPSDALKNITNSFRAGIENMKEFKKTHLVNHKGVYKTGNPVAKLVADGADQFFLGSQKPTQEQVFL